MNRERIMRRLDLVTGSTNSIVAVGAWCALNAHEANSILDCISERLCSPQTSGAQRVGLIYVIHELLLTCSKKGTPEEAKQLVLVAVSRMLPKVLDTVLDGQFMPSDRSPATEFVLAVEKALEWWGLLKLFSPKWFHTVEAKLRRIPSAAAPSGPDNCTAFITNVQRLSYCLSKYSELKARGSSADARRFLGVLAKEQAREFPDSSAFQQWLQAEWRGLTGSEVKQEADPHRGLPSAPGQAEEHHLLSPERTRIKMEAPDRFASGSSGLVSGGANSSSNSGMMGDALAMSASSAAVKPDDSNKKSGDEEEENDILGSFFD